MTDARERAREALEPIGWTEDDDWVEVVLEALAAAGLDVVERTEAPTCENCGGPVDGWWEAPDDGYVVTAIDPGGWVPLYRRVAGSDEPGEGT